MAVGTLGGVSEQSPPPLVDRLRSSRFGQQILGPRIAAPIAKWLTENLVEPPTGQAAEQLVAVDESDAASMAQPGSVGSQAAAVEAEVAAEDEVEELDLTPDSPRAVVQTLKALGQRVKVHNLVVVAAGIAFWGLLAIPATLFAVVSIAGLVLDADTVKGQVEDNLSGLPEEAQEIIGDQLEGVAGGSTGGLIAGVALGLLLAPPYCLPLAASCSCRAQSFCWRHFRRCCPRSMALATRPQPCSTGCASRCSAW